MDTFKALNIAFGNAICYSGFRDGQSPAGIHPSYEEIKEDLIMLSNNWSYIRLYDCDLHSSRVLEVIRNENLDIKVMLGAYIVAEINNHNCPWGGGVYPDEQLAQNKLKNKESIQRLIQWAEKYSDIISFLSVGNEATVDWTDHLVPVESIIDYVKMVKRETSIPVTFCENYVPWLAKLNLLAKEIDFISLHTYPVWEYKSIDESLDFTKENYKAVAELYPDIPVVITEAGWSTNSNGRGINPEHVNEENQKSYYNQLMDWVSKEKILTYVFEAFDEKWKGSPDPMEPEKHWGLFDSERKPKLVMSDQYKSWDKIQQTEKIAMN